MTAKVKKNRNLPKAARHRRTEISINYLTARYRLENNQPFWGVIETIDEDARECIPVLAASHGAQFINLVTGKLCISSVWQIAYSADVWYIPHREMFSFMVKGKQSCTITKKELIDVFGAEVIKVL